MEVPIKQNSRWFIKDPWDIADLQHDTCKSCGDNIYLAQGRNKWIHVDTRAMVCALIAEPCNDSNVA